MYFETWLKNDLKKPVKVVPIHGNVFSADSMANLIGVEIFDDGQVAEITGEVHGYAIREDGATVIIDGTLDGNKAYIILPVSCYTVVGNLSIVIKVGTTTVGAVTGNVYRTTTDTIVDPSQIIPSIDELLAKIDEMERGTAAANAAATLANTKAALADEKATLANTKAGLADTAATNADTKAGLANTAANNANAAASKIDDMTVSASGLLPGESPTAAISELSGHKHISFGIPKGDQGTTGTTPNISIGTVETLYPDQQAYVRLDQASTPEHPIFNMGLPKGDTGTIENTYASTIPMSPTDPTTTKGAIDAKVDKETGKGLSTNDYTTAEKNKLEGIAAGATANVVEDTLDSTSATNALSAAKGKVLNDGLASTQDGLAIIANGNTHAAIASGQFVYVKNHGSLAEGLYRATEAIGTNATLSTSNLTADSAGGLNALKADVDTLNSNISNIVTGTFTPNSDIIGTGGYRISVARIGRIAYVEGYFQPKVAINSGDLIGTISLQNHEDMNHLFVSVASDADKAYSLYIEKNTGNIKSNSDTPIPVKTGVKYITFTTMFFT